MEIAEATEYTDGLLESINALLPELSASARPITDIELKHIIGTKTVHLLLAEECKTIHATLTLVLFPTITGTRAWIEDVVVSKTARGKGVGRLLTSAAIDLATELGAKTIDLTSRPERDVAIKLYSSAGFVERETNVYRYIPG